jgi:hypothetical protein
MERKNPEPFIQEADDRVTKPVVCEVCDSVLEAEAGSVICITSDGDPLCRDHQSEADLVVSLGRCSGYPWKGQNPEIGETLYLAATECYMLQD